MDLKFIDRVIKATLILSAVFFPFLALYIKMNFALSVLFGAIWGTLNLWAIKIIIITMSPGSSRKPAFGLLILFLKLPVLYFVGYLLLTWKYLTIPGLLWGFSGIFIVALLKVLGRQYLGMDNTSKPHNDRSKPEGIKA